ncbi:electron transfer flavoprotein beta subunit/FixA family protein [Xylanimonas allomyrinae]|uniref:Electron transfer flavoprotein subunit beta n=1 Tax=Xylanimonas allomyrinae TaxID=2509459 RepID=A0A4P6EKP6_9MICO|nr:electron transfer flavoprotein subunit beta/FixA family protein [Xylanimonas allomyrinae]QAY63174.1 electron transfer flavoprotein beta subunit/FixA family protein [Xylanimonas allomyrinae]
MRIVVLLKYVPDISSDRRFAEGRIVRDPAEGSLNELDENAVEAALRLVEAAPDAETSHVVAVTVAPETADIVLRKAFQMGVHRGIRVSDDALAGSDYFGTTAALAAAVRRLGEEEPVDLVVTGMAALDGLGSVVPALLADELGWPQLTLATSVALDGSTLTITRESDDVVETLSAPLPAVLSVSDAANSPRYPNFKLIMAARTKPVETWDAADLELDPADVGAAGARTATVEAAARPPRPETELVVDKGEGGTALADFLIRNDLV